MTESQSQNRQSQRQSAPAGGGGAQPSSISSETREDLDKGQQEQSGDTHRQTDTGIGASDVSSAGARQDEQADYGTPRGPSAAGSADQAGENLTPTGADTSPELGEDADAGDEDRAIGMNGE